MEGIPPARLDDTHWPIYTVGRPLRGHRLDVLGLGPAPGGTDSEHVLLDGELDRVGHHPGQVEQDQKCLA